MWGLWKVSGLSARICGRSMWCLPGVIYAERLHMNLINFMEKKTGSKLVRAELYTALMFRGRPKVPAYVAELVLAPPGG